MPYYLEVTSFPYQTRLSVAVWKIQKRDLETGDTKPQGSATLKDTAFDIISLNDNSVLVEGKLYKKNEVVKNYSYRY